MVARTCSHGLLALVLLATTVSSLPKPAQDKDVAPNSVEEVTLSTELKPPPLPENDMPPGYLLIINLYSVKNASGETVDDMLENEVFEVIPKQKGPVASLLLLLDEDEDKDNAVNLRGFAEDMANEGFHVETLEKDGEVKVIIVDLDVMNLDTALNRTTKNDPERMTRVRTRRSMCMKCMMGGGGGGGGMKSMTIPVYVVPVTITSGGGMGHGGHGGGGGGCNPCQQGYGGHRGGGGGGGYGGSGGSYSQSSAQASAQSSSSGWGRKK